MSEGISQAAAHDGLIILSQAVSEARATTGACGAPAPVRVLGYSCIPDAELTDTGHYRAIVRAQSRSETITVVGRSFPTAREAITHAASVSLVDLYNGGAA